MKYLKLTNACNGRDYFGPFTSEDAAWQWFSSHPTTNIRSEVVDESELPDKFGAESQGINGASAASWNTLHAIK